MNLSNKVKIGYGLKSSWQELDSKSIFFTYTKKTENFNNLQVLALKKKCGHIICDHSLKDKIKINKKINYLFAKDLNSYAIKCSKIFFKEKIKIILITGTDGKTSIAYSLYNNLNKSSINTCYIGTFGLYANGKKIQSSLNTTPDLITIMNGIKSSVKNYKCKYLVIEASSIGYVEKRLGNIKADIGILTNLSQDHLDYHKNINNYHQAKIDLLKNHIKKGKTLLIQNKIPKKLSNKLNKQFDVIYQDDYLIKKNITIDNRDIFKTKILLDGNLIKKIDVPNNFVIKNLLTNYTLLTLMKVKFKNENILNNKTIKGRHQIIFNNFNKLVIVDYAHTPNGISNLLKPYSQISIIKIVIFGCGGDRDKNKRSKMSKLVNNFSDIQIITDDNPRNENPSLIRENLTKHCDNFYNIPNRLKAIKKGFALLKKNNGILFIIGKGHEETQVYKNITHKFSDIEESIKIAKNINF